MAEQTGNGVLIVDRDGYVQIEQWCANQNVSVKSIYTLLKRKKVNFSKIAGADVVLRDEIERVKREEFQSNVTKKQARVAKLLPSLNLKKESYKFAKNVIALGVRQDQVADFMNSIGKDTAFKKVVADYITASTASSGSSVSGSTSIVGSLPPPSSP